MITFEEFEKEYKKCEKEIDELVDMAFCMYCYHKFGLLLFELLNKNK